MQRFFRSIRTKKIEREQHASATLFSLRVLYKIKTQGKDRPIFQDEMSLIAYECHSNEELCECFRKIVFQCNAIKIDDQTEVIEQTIIITAHGKINHNPIALREMHSLQELYTLLKDQQVDALFPNKEQIAADQENNEAEKEQLITNVKGLHNMQGFH